LRGHPDLHGYTSLLVAISGSVSPVVEMTIPSTSSFARGCLWWISNPPIENQEALFSGRPNCAQNLGFRGWGR
jgi:hypothetical protein